MKELEDQKWFSSLLRNFQTEFIGFIVVRLRVYDVFIQELKKITLPSCPMVDLCSGSGEPAITIFRKSNRFTRLILTDKFPGRPELHDDRITYEQMPADVLQMQFTPGIFYTMFNALHHFSDDDKVRLAKKVLHVNSSASFVEILEPRISCFIKVIFTSTIGTLLMTPFIRPLSLSRLFFTYILPINILTITFDGIISVLKSRSANYYKALFRDEKQVEVTRLQNGLSPLIIIRVSSTT
ncbi:MAG: class I SAM-dependent methyltransferase [Bacteroidia bacterium]